LEMRTTGMVDAPSVGMAAVDRGGCRHAKLVRSTAPAMAKPWTVSRRVGTAVSLRRVPRGAPIAAIGVRGTIRPTVSSARERWLSPLAW
jgi:hypothetical protein